MQRNTGWIVGGQRNGVGRAPSIFTVYNLPFALIGWSQYRVKAVMSLPEQGWRLNCREALATDDVEGISRNTGAVGDGGDSPPEHNTPSPMHGGQHQLLLPSQPSPPPQPLLSTQYCASQWQYQHQQHHKQRPQYHSLPQHSTDCRQQHASSSEFIPSWMTSTLGEVTHRVTLGDTCQCV